MKKSLKRGFVMAETIIVSIVVLTALIILYTQFISINNSYYRSFRYNTVDDLYAVNNIKEFILNQGIENITNSLDSDKYIDLTNCSTSYFKEFAYCENLLKILDVKTLLFTYEDVSGIKDTLISDNPYSEGLFSFIKTISSDKNNKYRLIVEFNNDRYATLKIGEFFVSNISNECAKINNMCTDSQIKSGISMDVSVSKDETYTFNVIKDDGDNLTLIMNDVFEDSITWNNDPSNILDYLDAKTNGWDNVLDITYTLNGTNSSNFTGCTNYNTCTENIYTLSTKNSKSRLITIQELVNLGCTNTSNSCPSWLISGLSESSNKNGFWTSTANNNQAWIVTADSNVSSVNLNTDNIKIKPIIMIRKDTVK